MPDDIVMKYKGQFDYNQLYSTIRSHIENNKYTFKEGKFKQKTNEAEIKMEGERKVNEYFKYFFKVHLKVFRGKFPEKGLASGDIDLRITGDYEEDYQGIFKKKEGIFWHIIKKIVDFLMQKEKDEIHEDYLGDEMADLQKKIRKILGVKI